MSDKERQELQQRNAELAAQIELINKAWLCPYPECIMDELNEVINKTPAQCLSEYDREVAARAVEYVAKNADFTSLCDPSVAPDVLIYYANLIKTGEVEI